VTAPAQSAGAPGSVVVVGASAAGLSTVEALRRRGYRGSITVLGAEAALPYDRPPLSKQVLSGSWEPGRVVLRAPEVLDALGAAFVLCDPATGLDRVSRTVRTSSGRSWTADAIVIATGARPRAFPGLSELAGVHVLRTLDDALALRSEVLAAERVVVVGDGVLGAEIAATVRSMGSHVTMAGPQESPMTGQLGPMVGGLLGELHTDRGVVVRTSVAVTGATSVDGRVTGVRLATGEVLAADVVAVAVGAVAATEWLEGSGLRLDNGVVCDARCQAANGIYAAGDVARWYHGGLGRLVRLENRTNATEQADVVAANILGGDQRYRPVPYFWTDQFDAKIQVYGVPSPHAEVSVVEGKAADGRFVARYHEHGQAIAIVGWNMPKQARIRSRELISAEAMTGEPA
jgi:NADPH-dependent 2,4-dienoyl-CoA reductase/sulfur reductase-like enzyme